MLVYHYMVEENVYPGVESSSLCGRFGLIKNSRLSKTIPALDRPVCKSCKKKLAELGEPND